VHNIIDNRVFRVSLKESFFGGFVKLKKLAKKAVDFGTDVSTSTKIKLDCLIANHSQIILCCFGVLILSLGMESVSHAQSIIDDIIGGISGSGSITNTRTTPFDDSQIRLAVCQLFKLIEGSFGGLIMTVAGIGAIVASAFGGYKAAISLRVTGISAFILRSFVSLFFGSPCCDGLQIGAQANILGIVGVNFQRCIDNQINI
jgi:hypothetical protein